MKDLKIRWALHGPETEPTSRQRGMLIYRHLQSLGYDADAWDLQEPADIIVCQYDLKHVDAALATGAVVVQDVNDMVFAEHHKWHKPFAENLHRVHAVVAGTDRLAQHLERMHSFVRVIQEPVDGRYLAVKPKKHRGLRGGWFGMHDNLRYFAECDSALERLARKHDFTVHFICPRLDGFKKSNADSVKAKPYPTEFHEWTMETVLEQLPMLDFAVVPLFHNEWTAGKAANKALSFMAAGIPVVASDVIPYRTIIQHGRNGYLCLHPEDWEASLSSLLTKPKQRTTLSTQGRMTARQFSVDAICQSWIELFREIRPK